MDITIMRADVCGRCGNSADESWPYCGSCGTPLGETDIEMLLDPSKRKDKEHGTLTHATLHKSGFKHCIICSEKLDPQKPPQFIEKKTMKRNRRTGLAAPTSLLVAGVGYFFKEGLSLTTMALWVASIGIYLLAFNSRRKERELYREKEYRDEIPPSQTY